MAATDDFKNSTLHIKSSSTINASPPAGRPPLVPFLASLLNIFLLLIPTLFSNATWVVSNHNYIV